MALLGKLIIIIMWCVCGSARERVWSTMGQSTFCALLHYCTSLAQSLREWLTLVSMFDVLSFVCWSYLREIWARLQSLQTELSAIPIVSPHVCKCCL